MRTPFRRTLLLLAGAALLGAACRDGGSPTEGTPGRDEARVGFSLDVAGTSVSAIAVEVTAPDITSRLVFNIDVVNGVATGSITIPAGADRTITARAFDAKGILTHQGSKVVTVKGGANTSITITMVPAAGEQPLTINFGALVVQVSRVTAPNPGALPPETGDTVRYRAVIQNADGSPVNGKVRWASLNPAVAAVDSMGLVTARRPGQVEIAATYQGAGGSATFTVRGDGTEGSVDQTAPTLVGLAFADSINLSAGDTVLTFTVQAADAGSGVSSTYHYLNAPVSLGPPRSCSISASTESTNQVSWTCRIIFSRYHPAGTWSVGGMHLYDRSGNVRSFSESQLIARGINTKIKVVNSNSDTTAPVVSNISIAPDSINLATSTDTTVVVTVTASDPGAGISTVNTSFRGPAGTSEVWCHVGSGEMPAGTPTNQVTWSCSMRLPRTTPGGTYTMVDMRVYDAIGNVKPWTAEQVTAAGWEASFKVVK